MLPLDYAVLRFVRRFAPLPVMRLALAEEWGIRPGLETRRPWEAKARYLQAMMKMHKTFEGARVFVLGYGGSFGLGVNLLQSGAAHVILQDPYAPMWDRVNREVARSAGRYLQVDGRRVLPDPRWITVTSEHVDEYAEHAEPVDLALSSSVFEHIPDPAGVAGALARITKPDGLNLHIVDLRDHYFRYPFEMLCHSEQTWNRYLNPPANLNRFRLGDYQAAFSNSFSHVECRILESDPVAFHSTRHRIRQRFLTGDDEIDAATKILVIASGPSPTE